MPALTDWDGFSGLVRAIWACQSGAPETRAALKLMALLYPRPGELRLAAWREFDLDAATWSFPKERMKMRRPHTKPLPTQAVDILKDLRSLHPASDLVLPSAWAAGKPISENTMNTALHIGTNGSEWPSGGRIASTPSSARIGSDDVMNFIEKEHAMNPERCTLTVI